MPSYTVDELEEVLEELEKHRGRQTELITVCIPAGANINVVARQLDAEKSTAKNIKSTQTRKNVTEALEKISRILKEYKKTPENGLAIYAGNVSKTEGQQDLQSWEIEPPQPLKMRIYRCDKDFVLDPLKEMLEVGEVFGLLVMDRKEATIGLLESKRIEVIHKMTSGVPSKVRAGGQCLSPDTLVATKQKFKKIKDIKAGDDIEAYNLNSKKVIFTKVKNEWGANKKESIKVVLDDCWDVISSFDHIFFKNKDGRIVEVLAKDLKKGDLLISPFSGYKKYVDVKEIQDIKKIKGGIRMVDIETEAGNFFASGVLVHNSSQRFHRITEGLTKGFYKRIADEMKKIFYDNEKLKGIIVGGPIPTKDEFLDNKYLPSKLRDLVIGRKDIGDTDESGLKELVQKSQDILEKQEIVHEKKILEKFFDRLGSDPDRVAYKEKDVQKALEYGAVEMLILSKDFDKQLGKTLKEVAKDTGAEIEIVSTDTTEGEQFKKLSGMGAILRYRIE